MFCIAIVLNLRPGCLSAYRDAHDRIWSDMAHSMSTNNVSMAIFHSYGQLFVFATAPSEEHWKLSRAAPVLTKWNERMTEFVQSSPEGEIAFEFPEKVFAIGIFESTSRTT